MCEVFAISAGSYSKAQQVLPHVARQSGTPMKSWGIGFFRNSQACIETSSEQVLQKDTLYESWQRLMRVIDSPIVVSQINCAWDCGRYIPENRPFSLSFFEHTWLFVHVGRADRVAAYQTVHSPRIETDAYPARILEYLRDQLLSYIGSNPYAGLYKGLSYGIRSLGEDYPGRYAFLLANESVLFAFCNCDSWMVLKEPAGLGSALLLTSLKEGLNRPHWIPIRPDPAGAGKLVTIAGPDILHIATV